ncbi:MAG: response regulator [Chloroflexi bacterium]|nr:response regulator [Chloroflexota bacterium]
MDGKIRVVTVDDSAYARFAISRQLQSDPGIEVVGFARDGIEAIEKIKALKPDVVTLDVEMPRMDGLTALKEIMSQCPVPVVMISTQTGEGTEATVRALELGAVDFFLKPSVTRPAGGEGRSDGLPLKIRTVAAAKICRSEPQVERHPAGLTDKRRGATRIDIPERVVVIGSSTGGPRIGWITYRRLK